MPLTSEQLLGAIDETLRAMPPPEAFGFPDDDTLAWLGRARALLEQWSAGQKPLQVGAFVAAANAITGMGAREKTIAARQVRLLLNEARSDLQLNTIGPMTAAFDAGRVFDYFDEVRKVIEPASSDVFFVDPYLDADFVARYLPHVPAVDAFARQSGQNVSVRSAGGLHDRYVFVDGAACYQSGASFKDGAVKAPTTLTQITDAFDAVLKTYEDAWAAGKVER